jgi:phosphatidylglycerol lysyltransferase
MDWTGSAAEAASLRQVTTRTKAELVPTAHELVKRYGRTSNSFQALSKDMQHWFSHAQDQHACVAYTQTAGSLVVVGSAIAPESHEIDVMERFHEDARARGKRVRFFGIEQDLSARSSFDALHIGEEPVWDPTDWPSGVRKKVRDQIRRARNKGDISVRLASAHELLDPKSGLRHGIEEIMQCWLQSRRMAPMGFLVQLDPFHLAHERRFFVAEHEGRIVSALIAIPIYARGGWFFDQMLRHPSAPQCAIELLFDFAMKTFADEGVKHATFGLSPLAGSPSPVLQRIRDRTHVLYNFKGLHAFKSKLGPKLWQPIYLSYPKRERGVRAVYDALTAFTPRGPLRFAVDSLVMRARAARRSGG